MVYGIFLCGMVGTATSEGLSTQTIELQDEFLFTVWGSTYLSLQLLFLDNAGDVQIMVSWPCWSSPIKF